MKKIAMGFFTILSASFVLSFCFGCGKDDAPPVSSTFNVSANMTGAQEVPAVTTSGTGTVTGTYDSTTNTLNYSVSWSNLSGPATAAHFHAPAAAGTNGSVVVPFTIGTNGTSATGTATLSNAQEADLFNGLWYANVHTAAHTGGEIRGQVLVSR